MGYKHRWDLQKKDQSGCISCGGCDRSEYTNAGFDHHLSPDRILNFLLLFGIFHRLQIVSKIVKMSSKVADPHRHNTVCAAFVRAAC